jgi:hypothetical protein
LALELFRLQFSHNQAFQAFCRARGAFPETVDHWTQIPAVPTAAFKEWDLSCLPQAARTAVFFSSGTTGERPSRHFHSLESLEIYEVSLLPWFAQHLLADQAQAVSSETKGMRVVCLTPSPSQAPHSSLVHMCEAIRRNFGPSDSAFFGKVLEDGAWVLNLDTTVAELASVCAKGQPTLLLGTAFSFIHLLDHVTGHGVQLELPTGSRAMETGGYKGRSRVLSKPQLHAGLSEWLGIPRSYIISEYGMSELSSQAYDAAVPKLEWSTRPRPRVFRFPPWARAQVISPETGTEVEPGKKGVIRVVDLANVYSVMAVMTEDLATRRPDGFELIGRAVLAEPRGCSLMPA